MMLFSNLGQGAYQICRLPSPTPRDSKSQAQMGLRNLGFLPQRILMLGIPGPRFGTPWIRAFPPVQAAEAGPSVVSGQGDFHGTAGP